jgi:hypothetical protein
MPSDATLTILFVSIVTLEAPQILRRNRPVGDEKLTLEKPLI